ncbi:MAG: cell wall hydrolase [Holosporales bacterium]|jgi:hypothetical protein|nr:cell wall hydrolase [Holosporales bacterium]
MNVDIITMAKTIFGEARGEYKRADGGINSLIAIGNVVMNRYTGSDYTIEQVCLKPSQFSCWNTDDPNCNILKNISIENEIYRICLDISEQIINEKIGDITNGATHYYSKILRKAPYWAKDHDPVFEIGRHLFFKLPFVKSFRNKSF